MRRTCLLLAVVAVAALVAAHAQAAPPLVDTPKVLAGDYVDTSSIDTIVNGLFKSKATWTDEQKVLNFYHWYRRVVYPYRYMASDRRDVLKAINTAGFSLCGSQAAVTIAILRAAGYPARPVQVGLGPEWGHTVWDVKYDGRWHLFDAMTAFYVMTRDTPPHVASVEEIEADPTLVTKAVEEKRCGPEYCYTARNHEITFEERDRFIAANHNIDVPWSLLLTKPGTIAEFWNQAATRKKLSPGKEDDAYGAKCTPNVLDIKLKANERYVRQWAGLGKWMTAPSFPKDCPQNMAAGDNEKFDATNFKYFEPYRQAKPNAYNEAVYRTYGNGWLAWTPKSAEQFAQGVEKMEGFKQVAGVAGAPFPCHVLAVDDAAKAASMTFPAKSPYAVVEIEAELYLQLPEGATASLTLTPVNDGKPAAPKKVWTSAAKPSTAPDAAKAESKGPITRIVIPLVNTPAPIYDYLLKLDLAKAGGATVGLVCLKTTFQLNPMALPGLVPGANKIRVSAAQPGKIAGGKLAVTYNWFEAPEWQADKSDKHELTELPAEYEITLPAGEKLPKMKSLELFLIAD